MTTQNRLKKNVFYLSFEKGVNGCITIVLMPVIIRSIGIDNYGLWGILLGILGYLQFLDLGVSSSLERYVAFYHARKDLLSLQKLLVTSFGYLLLVSTVILINVILFGNAFMHLIIKNSSSVDITNILLFAFPAVFFNIITVVFMSIIRGLQRFEISSKIQITGKIVFACSLLLLLHFFNNIFAILIAYSIQSSSVFLLYFIISKKVLPTFSPFKGPISLKILKELITFGYKIQMSSLAFLVTQHFDKILLSSFFGLTYAGYYEAATRIIFAIRDIPMFLSSVLMPRISELFSQKNNNEINVVYVKTSQQLALFSFFLMVLTLFQGKTILSLLFNSAPAPFSLLVFNVLAIAGFWHVITSASTYIARGLGKTYIEMVAAIVTLFINIFSSLILLHFYSFNGVVFGTAIALFISPLLSYTLLNRVLQIRTRSFLLHVFSKPIFYLMFMLLFGYILFTFDPLQLDPKINIVVVSLSIVLLTHLYYTFTHNTVYRDFILILPIPFRKTRTE